MRKTLILLLAVLFAFSCKAYAGNQFDLTGFSIDSDGDVTARTVTTSTGNDRQVNLPLPGFVNDGANATLNFTSTVTPHFVSPATGAYLNWDTGSIDSNVSAVSGESATPILITFRVPDDYRTNPAFVITCKNAQYAVTPNYIDWDIVVHSDASAAGDTQYNQTSTSLADSSANIDQVSLSYATASDISAGDLVSFRFWADRIGYSGAQSSTADLRVFGAAFKYRSQH